MSKCSRHAAQATIISWPDKPNTRPGPPGPEFKPSIGTSGLLVSLIGGTIHSGNVGINLPTANAGMSGGVIEAGNIGVLLGPGSTWTTGLLGGRITGGGTAQSCSGPRFPALARAASYGGRALEGVTGSGTSTGAGRVFSVNRGARVTGRVGILSGAGDSSVTVGGTVVGTSGTAIQFGGGNDTLALWSKAALDGNVVAGAGTDKFALGGAFNGQGRFNVSEIGPSGKFQGFELFEKTGFSTWTLTGNGNQNWAIIDGTLQGDTNSLQGNLLNGSILVFDQAFDGTFGGGHLRPASSSTRSWAGRASGDESSTTARPWPGAARVDGSLANSGSRSAEAFSREPARSARSRFSPACSMRPRRPGRGFRRRHGRTGSTTSFGTLTALRRAVRRGRALTGSTSTRPGSRTGLCGRWRGHPRRHGPGPGRARALSAANDLHDPDRGERRHRPVRRGVHEPRLPRPGTRLHGDRRDPYAQAQRPRILSGRRLRQTRRAPGAPPRRWASATRSSTPSLA